MKGVAAVRIVVGLLLIVHGSQLFNSEEMLSYQPWLTDLNVPLPLFSAYVGKGVEFIGGLCFILGIWIRAASVFLMATFVFITVVMGGSKIFTDGQHPFLFFLFSLLFFFVGDSGYGVKRLWSQWY
ncbi:MAG TPA: DoxX family protein [Sphingobacteriaceae bacterium]